VASSPGQGGDTLANPTVLDFGVTENNANDTDLGDGFGHSEVDASGW